MTVLKIDRDARRDERRAELSKILRDAVWGESATPATLKLIVGALVRWHSSHGSSDPINDGVATVVECASLRLIRQVGGRWVPASEVHG